MEAGVEREFAHAVVERAADRRARVAVLHAIERLPDLDRRASPEVEGQQSQQPLAARRSTL